MAKLLLPIICCILLIPLAQSRADTTANNSPSSIPSNGIVPAATTNPEFPEMSTEDKTAKQALEKGGANAINIYQQAIAKNNQDKVASIGLIRAAIQQKKYDMAAKELALYRKKFGEDDRYLTEQAHYYSKTGKKQQALAILGPLLQKDPTNDALLDIKMDALANSQNITTSPQNQPVPVTENVKKPLKNTKNTKNTIKTSSPIAATNTTKAITKTNKLTNSYVEAGVERDSLTHNYGNWSNQYVKGFFQVNDKNAWYGELYHDYEFFQHGDFAKVEQTHIYNEDYYSTVSFGMSDNSIYIPKYYVGGSIFKKQLKQKQLIAYLGFHAYWWRPNSSSEDINPGFVYYFEKPWIFEAGLYINRSNPGVIYTASGYTAVTQGREKEHYITVRVGLGKESYLPLGGNVAVVGYASEVLTVTWRQWIGQNWGTNIIAERYHNKFYDRAGITLGLFKDFAL
jgi:YaiO family outer membrane protein